AYTQPLWADFWPQLKELAKSPRGDDERMADESEHDDQGLGRRRDFYEGIFSAPRPRRRPPAERRFAGTRGETIRPVSPRRHPDRRGRAHERGAPRAPRGADRAGTVVRAPRAPRPRRAA